MNTFYRNSTNTDTALFALCIDYSLDKPILFASDVCIQSVPSNIGLSQSFNSHQNN